MEGAGHIAAFTAPPGQLAELLAMITPQFDLVLAEPATLLYLFNLSDGAPDTVWSYERYTDEAGFHAHGHAPSTAGLGTMQGLSMAVAHLKLMPGSKGLPATASTALVSAERVSAVRGYLVKLVTEAGRRSEVFASMAPMLDAAHADPSTLLFLLHAAEDSDDTAWLYAVFADADALKAHFLQPENSQVWPAIAPLVTSLDMKQVRILGGKGLAP